MSSFTAHIEIDNSPTELRIESLMEAFAQWQPAVGRSDHGLLEVTVTYDAPDLWKAMGFARENFDSPGNGAIRFEVLPTHVFDSRSDHGQAAHLPPLSVSQAADQLGVSRQRVLQMIHEGKLEAERLGTGRPTYMVSAGSLAQLQSKG